MPGVERYSYLLRHPREAMGVVETKLRRVLARWLGTHDPGTRTGPKGIQPDEVVDAYRTLLLRDPRTADITTLCEHGRDAAWVREQLRDSLECRTVVQPLRELLANEWRSWVLRAPDDAELRRDVDATRGRIGSDDAVRAALADGSIGRRLAFRPLKIEMDITNQCNLRCVMCHFSLPSFYQAPRRHISQEQFDRLGAQVFHRAHQVALSYGTEPLLHADLPGLLASLARHEVPHTYLHTNGLLLSERVVEAMVDHGFSLVFVSIDAATAATYERIRVGGSFARLMQNLRMLRAVRERRGSLHPALGLGFVLLRDNVDELPAFLDLAAEVGAVSVNVTHMAAWESVGNAALAASHDQARCNAALAAAHDRAAHHGISLVAPPPFAGVPTPGLANAATRAAEFGLHAAAAGASICPFPWGFVGIDPEGDVHPCGWWDKVTYGSMGNVFQTDFASIWRGAAFEALRGRLRARRIEGSCAKCPAAGMGNPDAASSFAP